MLISFFYSFYKILPAIISTTTKSTICFCILSRILSVPCQHLQHTLYKSFHRFVSSISRHRTFCKYIFKPFLSLFLNISTTSNIPLCNSRIILNHNVEDCSLYQILFLRINLLFTKFARLPASKTNTAAVCCIETRFRNNGFASCDRTT